MKPKIIVSACLAGLECRYDCASQERAFIRELVEKGEAIPVCPEQMGGLPTPRPPAEIQGERVISVEGKDVSYEYARGAREALKIAELIGAREALLKSKSPMCGSGKVYDGSFQGKLVEGDGIFTRLLKKKGLKVTSVD